MDPEKDVLDGWCMYMEKSAGSGSNSSDSESIEIISEDEAGNYQIYSKKYFKPDIVKEDSIPSNINKEKENSPIVSEIKEYCENDPMQFLVEEGKEAQEKELEVKATKVIKKERVILQLDNNCENDKDGKKSVEKAYQASSRVQSFEIFQKGLLDKIVSQNQEKEKWNKATLESFSDTISRESQVGTKSNLIEDSLSVEGCEISSNTTISDTVNKIIEANNIGTVMSKRDVEVNEMSAGSMESEITKVEKSNDRSDSEQEVSNILVEKIDENQSNYSATKLRETSEKISVSNNSEDSTKCSSKIQQKQTNISLLDSPLSSSTNDNCPTSTTSDGNTVSRNPSCVKKARIEIHLLDTVETFSGKSEKLVPLDTPSITSSEEFRPSCELIGVKKARKRLISGKKAMNKEVKESCGTSCVEHLTLPADLHLAPSSNSSPSNSIIAQPDSTRTQQDISTLVLFSVVGLVIYLIFSTLILPNPDSVVPQTAVRTAEDNPVSVHDRYFQLVANWEAKVLENAELDYRIALKEKTEQLSCATRQTSAAPASLPDCLARHVLSHAFVYLREHPPDIADLPRWSKTKFCVDLSLLLAPMRAASFRAVLKLLTFLVSPGSALDYQAVFDHYLSQQKTHIHDVIQSDYPEIYRSGVFHRPQKKLRPHMYCVSMQRFSVLKHRFAPGQDNMAALLRLSELYVRREACLRAAVQGDGRSLDQLFSLVLDVLLARSISTAITLDPSLLHDYYLELTLSNEANLEKLSRQLFKYNVLAIQKFNLSLEKESTLGENQNYKVQHERRNLYGSKDEEFLMVRDGDDEFLLLNKEFDEDWKDQQKEAKIKLVSLSKEKVELFYDRQLREISNGYSSKVRKFLSDLNKDLKHALCHPYAHAGQATSPASEREESLVRFIRNMCRANVFSTEPAHGEEPGEFSQVVHDYSLRMKTELENNSHTPSIIDSVFSQESPMSFQDVPIGNYSMIDENEFLNTKDKPETVIREEHHAADFEIENDKGLYHPPKYNAHDKEMKHQRLKDPESHIYRETDFVEIENDRGLYHPSQYNVHDKEKHQKLKDPESHIYHENDFVEIESAFEIENDKGLYHPPQYNVHDKEMKHQRLKDPESHIYRENDFVEIEPAFEIENDKGLYHPPQYNVHDKEMKHQRLKDPESHIYRENDFVEIEPAFEIENDKGLYHPPQYNVHDKEMKHQRLKDPENHIYRETDSRDRLLLIPEEQAGYNFSSKDKKHFILVDPDKLTGNILTKEHDTLPQDIAEGDDGNVEKPLRNEKYYNMILNKMANSLGLNNMENEPVIDAYNIETFEEHNKNLNNPFDKIYTRHKTETLSQKDSLFDDFDYDSKKNRKRKPHSVHYEEDIRNHFDKHGDREHRRGRKYKVNAYNTAPHHARHRAEEKDNGRGSHSDRGDAYDSQTTEQRSHVYSSRSSKPSRSSQEERIVHIDGHDNRFTRHVYIDNAARDSEMDWWLNRRARLRAKLRKKHVYPRQDNPEHHWDFLYE